MERRSGIGVDCSITRSSADYRRHMQMTRCCTIRNAHNETCSISQKVVATASTVPHWLGPGQWPLAASGADTIRCANQAGCPIALHLHLEEKPKEFLPADHCSALSIRADRATDICICLLYLGNLFVFP